MLKELATAFGVSGIEQEVRDTVIKHAKPFCDQLTVDFIGNVVAFKKGRTGNKTIMICAHMDEVGLIVTEITKEGYLKFKPIGGVDSRVLISKSVLIGKNKIVGVIGSKPKHLIKEDQTAPQYQDLFIDVGAKNEAELDDKINLGDYVCFDSEYVEFGDGLIKSKALDDRVGCAVLLDLMKEEYDPNTYFVFTVQEEVGCRGAKVISFTLGTDEAIVIEGTTCSDLAVDKDYQFSTKLGKGAALSILDRGSYANKCIVNKLYTSAIENKIKVQFKQTTLGGNDASAIHIAKAGIKTAVISVPCRYIHSPSSVASKDDIQSCRDILYYYLKGEV